MLGSRNRRELNWADCRTCVRRVRPDGRHRCQRLFEEMLPSALGESDGTFNQTNRDLGSSGVRGPWELLTRFSAIAGLSAPRTSFWEAEVN
jgi:hypothetical protein